LSNSIRSHSLLCFAITSGPTHGCVYVSLALVFLYEHLMSLSGLYMQEHLISLPVVFMQEHLMSLLMFL
jgi:hypothetical protein